MSCLFRKFLLLFIFSIFSLSVFSCKFSLPDFLNHDESQDENEELFEITGSLSSSLSGAVPRELIAEKSVPGDFRTAFPTFNLSSSLYYTVTASSGTKTVNGTINSSTLKYSISLGLGSWDLTITAFSDAAKTKHVLKGTKSLSVTSSGVSGDTAVKLNGIMEDTSKSGSANLTLNYTDSVKKLRTAVYYSDGTKIENTYTLTSGSDIISLLDIKVGAHPVSFAFYDTNDLMVYSFIETINIFENLITNTWVNSGSFEYFSDDGINVSTTCLENFKKTSVYVSSSGDDTKGNGDFLAPFATIQKAVDRICSYGNTSTEYKILLMSNFTCNTAITKTDPTTSKPTYIIVNPDTVINIKIASSASAKRTININNKGRGIYCGPRAKLILENISLSGASVESDGGGIYIGGNCTLGSGTEISSCKALSSGSGGGVYSAGTLNVNSGVIISSCTAGSVGGGVCVENGIAYLNSCTIKSCSAPNGGGISNAKNIYIYGTTTVGGASSDGNSTTDTSTGSGGGIYSTAGSVNFGYSKSGTASSWTGSVSSNSAVNGGGIAITGGALTFSSVATGSIGGSSATANTATGNGGGIYNVSTTSITLNYGTISYNQAKCGGGIYNEKTLTLSGASVSYNTATEDGGGGVYNTGTLSITAGAINSNIGGNADGGSGGGVYSTGTFYLSGTANIYSNQGYQGGGIFNIGTLTLGATASNASAGYTGAIYSNKAMAGALEEGGGAICNNGTLTMKAGTIGGASTKSNTAMYAGGGILNNNSFTMSGGTISYNKVSEDIESSVGGGVASIGTSSIFIMSGGKISLNTATSSGGGVYNSGSIYLSGSATIGGSSTEGNSVSLSESIKGNGGGLFSANKTRIGYTYDGSSETATAWTGSISGNSAFNGGGIYQSEGTLNISSSASGTIGGSGKGNKAVTTAHGYGGGIYTKGVTNIANGYISYNEARYGGGIYSEAALYMSGGQITANEGKWQGGGIYTRSNLFIYGSAIIGGTSSSAGNKSTDSSYGYGGGIFSNTTSSAIYLGYSSATSTSATAADWTGYIACNTAVNKGGGVYNSNILKMNSGTIGGSSTKANSSKNGGGIYNSVKVEITGGTISYNEASLYGGGIYSGDDTGDLISLTGGSVESNSAVTSGSGIYVAYGKVNMGGSISIPYGSDYTQDIFFPYSVIQKKDAITLTSSLSTSSKFLITSSFNVNNYNAGIDMITSTAVTGTTFTNNVAKYIVGTQPFNGQIILSVTSTSGTSKAQLKKDSEYAYISSNTQSYISGSNVFVNGRSIVIPAMIVSDHELTQKEYKQFSFYDEKIPGTTNINVNGNSYASPVGDNYPAIYVSWYDALVYCNLRSMAEGFTPVYSYNGKTNPAEWTSVTTGTGTNAGKYRGPKHSSADRTLDSVTFDTSANGWRLPTEAEWEYLARGGKNYTYSGSDTYTDVAWTSTEVPTKQAQIVKQLQSNDFSLYDMSGNVFELVWDWYGGTITASTDTTGATTPTSAQKRVVRGGGMGYAASYATVSNRDVNNYPYERWENAGFRIVRNQ